MGRGLRLGGGAGRRSRPSGRSGLRALAGGESAGGCGGGAPRPGRIPLGAMSVDKAELCGSLLTWVGLGWGQGQVCARSFLPGAPALALSTPSSSGWEEEGSSA